MYLVAERGVTALLQKSFRLFNSCDEAVQYIIDTITPLTNRPINKYYDFSDGRGYKVFEFTAPGVAPTLLDDEALRRKSQVYKDLLDDIPWAPVR